MVSPLVADIHFDYRIALLVADSADCLRINPGNIGKENKVQEIIQAAKDNDIPQGLVLMLVHWRKIFKRSMESLTQML